MAHAPRASGHSGIFFGLAAVPALAISPKPLHMRGLPGASRAAPR
ncbi:hypothetical protein SFOMI_2179 [Sphingobium fuliginis]|uniref:Uncharacterized protein n=1 Tax=Sphingobium fuliginis (strain ATCC 27551) TaxID=336203 RepID=A0A292ZFJ3_SPHSA|nr:hypothetical protein SFOMI_2179 [Sphingobium fuliginis]